MPADRAIAAVEALHQQHRACVRCVEAGHIERANPVFSGHAGQRIMLVGQAPGPVEHDVTRPFAGRAGAQLMRWMMRAGFRDEEQVRAQVFITSMTTCFPGRNAAGTGDRRPSAAEVRLCSTWLDGYLALVQPRLIIPTGTLALGRFLRGRTLDDLVGHAFGGDGTRCDDPYPSRWPVLLPLPHPSGQSRWLNDPARAARVETALRRLAALREWA